jgi:hypothetical protein
VPGQDRVREPEPLRPFCHLLCLGARLRTQAVVDSRNRDRNRVLLPPFGDEMHQGDGIGTARDGNNNPACRRERAKETPDTLGIKPCVQPEFIRTGSVWLPAPRLL